MWKFILMAALCLFQSSSSSTTPEKGGFASVSGEKATELNLTVQSTGALNHTEEISDEVLTSGKDSETLKETKPASSGTILRKQRDDGGSKWRNLKDGISFRESREKTLEKYNVDEKDKDKDLSEPQEYYLFPEIDEGKNISQPNEPEYQTAYSSRADLSDTTASDVTAKNLSRDNKENESEDSMVTRKSLNTNSTENVSSNFSSTEVATDIQEIKDDVTHESLKILSEEPFENITKSEAVNDDEFTTLTSSDKIPVDKTSEHTTNFSREEAEESITSSPISISVETTLSSQIVDENSPSVPLTTPYVRSSEQILTEEMSLLPTAIDDKSPGLEFHFSDKEINSSQPSVASDVSSGIYSKENPENAAMEPFENSEQNKNTHKNFDFTEENLFSNMSRDSNKELSTTNVFSFDNSFFDDTYQATHDVSTNTAPTNSDLDEKSEVSNETTSISDFIEPGDYNFISEETGYPSSKQLLNHTYKLILRRNCSGDTFISHIFQPLNSVLNSKLNSLNSTKLLKSECVYEVNFTSNVASPESFNKIIDVIKKESNNYDVLEVSIVNYDSTIYQNADNADDVSENFLISKTAVYTIAGSTVAILIFLVCSAVCIRNKCKRNSTSLDLSDIPHLSISVDDYKLAPIPRPSVSFPESSREFLHAFSNETYSRTRGDDTLLTQHHFSGSNGKTYDVIGGAKETPLVGHEMKTFSGRRCASRNRNDVKSSSSHEYASADSWDRLKGKENGKKVGMDNPSFRRW